MAVEVCVCLLQCTTQFSFGIKFNFYHVVCLYMHVCDFKCMNLIVSAQAFICVCSWFNITFRRLCVSGEILYGDEQTLGL